MLPVNRHHQWACPLLVRTRLFVSEGCCLGWGDGTFILYREDQRVAGSWVSHTLINLGQACFYLGVKFQRYVIFLWCTHTSAAEERTLWTAVLEAEENERLKPLRANMKALESGETLTPNQINGLLVSAVQAQITLLRMSRVFPEAAANRRVDVTSAVRHGPTMELASELRLHWSALGVTDSTLKLFLRRAIAFVGSYTRRDREQVFADTKTNFRYGVEPEAKNALAAEGAGKQFRTV